MSRKPRKQDRRKARQAKRGEIDRAAKVYKRRKENAAAATAAEDDSSGYRPGRIHPAHREDRTT